MYLVKICNKKSIFLLFWYCKNEKLISSIHGRGGHEKRGILWPRFDISTNYLHFILDGLDNGTYSSAPQQPEKELPQWPSAAEF